MATPTSIPSFARRVMKIKGKTLHTGRGSFHMEYDIEPEELLGRLQKLVENHASVIDEYENNENSFMVTFKPLDGKVGVFGDYRVLFFEKTTRKLFVLF